KAVKKKAVGKRTPKKKTARKKAKQPARRAPVLWKFRARSQEFGLFIDDELCWCANETGNVFALDHKGEISQHYKLPKGVKCLVRDQHWLYAGSDDGKVYDLSRRQPSLAYEVKSQVLWLDIYDGALTVSDGSGNVFLFNPEGERMWANKGAEWGWMVRIDGSGVYHGCKHLTKYDLLSGDKLWRKQTKGNVMFGWQEADAVYAGTTKDFVQAYSKSGRHLRDYSTDDTVYSCAASANGEYVFAGDSSGWVYCFAENGKRLWKLQTGCGDALSMQFHDGRVYIVTTSGYLACIDASEDAIEKARQGHVPTARATQADAGGATRRMTDALETTNSAAGGVVVECVREGGKVRVRPVSSGYHADWNVQFPRNVRVEGAKFVVEELRVSLNGTFYRAYGEIKRLVSGAAAKKKTAKKKSAAAKKKTTKKKAVAKKKVAATKKRTVKKKAVAKKKTAAAPKKKVAKKKTAPRKKIAPRTVKKATKKKKRGT
ncbi:MAG: PQQ-binding-like beta-propeller repeat protein, partial [Planctomycetales bacterium]